MAGDRGQFEVTVESVEGAGVVHVVGELDLATTSKFEAAVSELGGQGRLVVDLSECTFLDSSALRSLMAAGRAHERDGFSIVASQPSTLRVLEIASVDQVFPVRETLAEAL